MAKKNSSHLLVRVDERLVHLRGIFLTAHAESYIHFFSCGQTPNTGSGSALTLVRLEEDFTPHKLKVSPPSSLLWQSFLAN